MAPHLSAKVHSVAKRMSWLRNNQAMKNMGTRWDKMGQDGTRWDKMGQDGTRWDKMGQDGTRWDKCQVWRSLKEVLLPNHHVQPPGCASKSLDLPCLEFAAESHTSAVSSLVKVVSR